MREDPTDLSGRLPDRLEPEWFVYRAELPGGRLLVSYQALEDERVILVSAVDLIPHEL